jgi:uncharacterized membrane protein YedE/YeeE
MNTLFIHWMYALEGGMLIGLAAALLVLFIGRIMGVSSILDGAVFGIHEGQERVWRLSFVVGVVLSPWLWLLIVGRFPEFHSEGGTFRLILAGLLVGFGTRLGMGCTSGHGICGLSRFSRRSIVATLIFMSFAIFTVSVVRGRWL